MIGKSEFIEAAQAVRGAYSDFVLGTYLEAKQEGFLLEVFNFMKSNKGATTDDVCEFMNSLEGCPKPYEVEASAHLQAV